jgi:hypothetical protein
MPLQFMCRLMRRLAWSVVECRCHPRRRRIERAASGRDRRVERTTMSEQLRSELRPTVARIWRGRVRAERADAYETYYMEAGIQPLIDAALGVQALREDRGDEVEFVTISYWEDVAAMSRFAGDDPRRIHHLDRDPEFLVELPTGVQVLEIRAAHGDTGGG